MSVYESLRLEIQYRAFVYLVTGSQMLGEKLVEVLHEQRYGVKSFSSDEALVKAWRRVPPDVVLLDGARSEGDIIELCRRIKSDPRVAPTPVVVMVERDDLVGRREAFDAHADEVLLYPFPKFELLARLRAQLELERLHAQVRRPVSGVEGERAVGTPPKSQTAASQNAASGAEDGPSRSAAPPSTRSAGEGGDRGAPLQILVADESRPIRELLEHHLEAEGWSVELASQGREAEEKLSERDYDVVVVDLEMRFRSGFEILEAIQERDGDRPRAHLMALTSMPRDETMVRAFELGADDVVSKPLRPEVVAARLRRLQRRGDREEAS
jgi:DNA-binding response OmpR family regulator